ncbi:ammonium transporter AmtB-like domain-containing protein [Chytriomyces sp. MP71]|nr:ammonium transporter AmtB-like domain-containing protein [Chytriomyces sp. MP71]
MKIFLTRSVVLASLALCARAQTYNTAALVSGDVAWVLISSALVFFMIPGLGYFYSGLVETKNAQALLHVVLLIFAVVCVQWCLIGYTISFSDTSPSTFIGDVQYAALLKTTTSQNAVAATIPASCFALYQMMFAGITPGLFVGATAGRMRFMPTMIFSVLWSTVVYDPICYWIWSNNGWLHNLNVMDYAGGCVVHVSAGTTALVLAILLPRRKDFLIREYQPHSPNFVYLGTAMLWFGWMGFNGGSSVAANMRGADAVLASNLAASAGGLVWMGLDAVVNRKRFGSVSFCTGAVAGLATITPGSGFVQPGFGLIIGGLAGVVCFYSVRLVKRMRIDDSLDVTGVHGVGGALGTILTGAFAQYSITSVNATTYTAGWVDRVWVAVGVQVAAVVATAAWSALWSIIFVLVLNVIPGMQLRCSEEAEITGLDISEVGEKAYEFLDGSDEVVTLSQSVRRGKVDVEA